MVNITHKSDSLRIAIASAIVTVSKPETIEAVNKRKVPKGDVFEFSRAAGLLAVKRTSDSIPDCHPLPIEFTGITFFTEGLNIIINVEVHAIYKTGVEVEAMHGAAVTALTIYDMLKPIDPNVEISNIKLISKKGGKTDFKSFDGSDLRSAVIVCSDSIAAGKSEDKSGQLIVDDLKKYQIAVTNYEIIPDEFDRIQSITKKLSDEGFDMILFTGGTGLSPRDVTPDAIKPLLDREIPGIMEIIRNYGQERMPYSMLSRGVAGFIKNTLVITLPGSPKGVKEALDAVFPHVLHLFSVVKGNKH
jgi:molybdenum cofactor synthesis domain-containing protein